MISEGCWFLWKTILKIHLQFSLGLVQSYKIWKKMVWPDQMLWNTSSCQRGVKLRSRKNSLEPNFWHSVISMQTYLLVTSGAGGNWTRCQGDLVQWRIQDFPKGCANPREWCANLFFGKIFAKNCITWKNMDGGGGGFGGLIPWIDQCGA